MPSAGLVVSFDKAAAAAAAAAQQWMQQFQTHCSRQPADELFKLFKRDATVCFQSDALGCCHALLLHAGSRRLLPPEPDALRGAQVHIVNMAMRLGKAAFGAGPDSTLRINCTIGVYYRHVLLVSRLQTLHTCLVSPSPMLRIADCQRSTLQQSTWRVALHSSSRMHGCMHRTLHSMLLAQPHDAFEDPDPDAVRRILASDSLQLGLLACAAELVQYACSQDPSFPDLAEQRLGVLGCVLDMWESLAHMARVLQQACMQCCHDSALHALHGNPSCGSKYLIDS